MCDRNIFGQLFIVAKKKNFLNCILNSTKYIAIFAIPIVNSIKAFFCYFSECVMQLALQNAP